MALRKDIAEPQPVLYKHSERRAQRRPESNMALRKDIAEPQPVLYKHSERRAQRRPESYMALRKDIAEPQPVLYKYSERPPLQQKKNTNFSCHAAVRSVSIGNDYINLHSHDEPELWQNNPPSRSKTKKLRICGNQVRIGFEKRLRHQTRIGIVSFGLDETIWATF